MCVPPQDSLRLLQLLRPRWPCPLFPLPNNQKAGLKARETPRGCPFPPLRGQEFPLRSIVLPLWTHNHQRGWMLARRGGCYSPPPKKKNNDEETNVHSHGSGGATSPPPENKKEKARRQKCSPGSVLRPRGSRRSPLRRRLENGTPTGPGHPTGHREKLI